MASLLRPRRCPPAGHHWTICWAATAMQASAGAGLLSAGRLWQHGRPCVPAEVASSSLAPAHSTHFPAHLPCRCAPVRAAAGKSLQAGGLDVLYCSHRDGSLSVWQRHPRLLTYVCLGATKLMPPVSKFGTGELPEGGGRPPPQRGDKACSCASVCACAILVRPPCPRLYAAATSPCSSSNLLYPPRRPPAAPTVLALAAGLWHGLEAAPASDAAAEVGALLSAGGRRHPGAARRVPSAPNHNSRSSTDGAEGSAGDIDEAAAGRCVLLMGAASDGRVWQWQVPLLAGALPDPKPAALPAAPKPELLGTVCCPEQGGTPGCCGARCGCALFARVCLSPAAWFLR